MRRFLWAAIFALTTLQQAHSESKVFSSTLSTMFMTKSVYRGAEFWPKPMYFVAPSLQFFGQINVRGPNISWTPFDRKSQHDFTLGFQIVDDAEPPLTIGDHEEDFRNKRSTAYDLLARYVYKFGYRNKFELGASVSREIYRYKGLFTELLFGAPLLPFTSLRYRLGIGEKSSNEFAYGEGSNGGLAYHALNLTVVFPFLPWKGILINSFERTKIIQGQNRQGNFIRGQDEQNLYRFLMTWTFY